LNLGGQLGRCRRRPGEDHRRCDSAFAQAEAAARCGDMARCAGLFRAFRGAMLRHFRMEEDVLSALSRKR
jgi:hypothetical protein